MLQTLRNAWKIPELRKKFLYTFLLLVVFRFGSVIPVPWIDANAIADWMQSAGGGTSLFNLLDTFSGGAFSQATIFAMSISPYINSSIIMQLLCQNSRGYSLIPCCDYNYFCIHSRYRISYVAR